MQHQDSRLRKRISDAARRDNRAILRKAERAYLNSYFARFVAAYEALEQTASKHRDSNGNRTRCGNLLQKAEALAARMNLWQPCEEVVRVLPSAKEGRPESDPEYRFIFSFGVEHRARQLLLKNLLKARWATAPSQTLFNGGTREAVRQIQQHFAEGFTHVVRADVRKCYHSFDTAGMASSHRDLYRVAVQSLESIGRPLFNT